MIINKIKLENYTVFNSIQIDFARGINIFIGENGTGKTHLLKVLYSACQCADPKISFAYKIVSVMLPDDYNISRLISRRQGNSRASIRVTAIDELQDSPENKLLTASFCGKTSKWNADVTGEQRWEAAFKGASSIFIPAKEILSHSYNLNAAAEKNNVRFDATYTDIINAAKIDISVGRNSAAKNKMLSRIQELIHGKVYYDAKRDEFYLKNENSKQEFNLVAEGIRKMALLWQLIKNGTMEKGSVLFWDEPEANINPAYVSVIVEMLLELQRKGVQIFLSTHDYMLATYFDVRKISSDNVLFHSLSHNSDTGELEYEHSSSFSDLKNNAIIATFNKLLDEVYDFEA